MNFLCQENYRYYMHTDRQMDGQTDRQTDRQADIRTDTLPRRFTGGKNKLRFKRV